LKGNSARGETLEPLNGGAQIFGEGGGKLKRCGYDYQSVRQEGRGEAALGCEERGKTVGL
jgi:hypothetical protein